MDMVSATALGENADCDWWNCASRWFDTWSVVLIPQN